MSLDDFKIPVERLSWTCDPALFDFETTEELPDLEDAIGQKRALRSIEFGLGMEETGFNLFISGETGTGRTSTIRKYSQKTGQERAAAQRLGVRQQFQGSVTRLSRLPCRPARGASWRRT